MKKTFRPEIAGMRALSVMAVLLFHIGFEKFSGGFVGVDVFFVLSGFLITGIIIKSLENRSFSFYEFYSHRAKRIFPASIITILTSILIAIWLLSPSEYIDLSKSALYSLLFTANIYFFNNTGYFDQSAELSPLLHMWSLGIEEQFYLLFPILLYIVFKYFGRFGTIIFLSLSVASSLLLSITITEAYQTFSFFMLPTRIWQLALGGCISLAPRFPEERKILGNVISFFGLSLIIYAILNLSNESVYPGFWAILPTIGAALFIHTATSKKNIFTLFMSLKPFVWIGNISYSVYLWHWPLIVFYRIYILERKFSLNESLLLLVFSLLLGWISWLLIEEKFRYINFEAKKTVKFSSLFILFTCLLPIGIINQKGFPSRIENETAKMLLDRNKMWEYECVDSLLLPGSGHTCVVGVPWKQSKIKGIVWGDSHSEHFAQILHEATKNLEISLVIGPRSCPAFIHKDTIIDHYTRRDNFTEICTRKQDAIVQWLKKRSEIKLIIFASAWSGYKGVISDASEKQASNNELAPDLIYKGMKSLINKLDLTDRHILILGDIPRPGINLNPCVAKKESFLLQSSCKIDPTLLGYENIKKQHFDINKSLLKLQSFKPNILTLLPTDFMCTEIGCPTYINDEFIYKDSNHIRRNLKEKTAKIIAKKIKLEGYFSKISKIAL